MDRRVRGLEKRARGGDLDAAWRWLNETGRIKDYPSAHEAMLQIFDLRYPKLAEQLARIQGVNDLIERDKRNTLDYYYGGDT